MPLETCITCHMRGTACTPPSLEPCQFALMGTASGAENSPRENWAGARPPHEFFETLDEAGAQPSLRERFAVPTSPAVHEAADTSGEEESMREAAARSAMADLAFIQPHSDDSGGDSPATVAAGGKGEMRQVLDAGLRVMRGEPLDDEAAAPAPAVRPFASTGAPLETPSASAIPMVDTGTVVEGSAPPMRTGLNLPDGPGFEGVESCEADFLADAGVHADDDAALHRESDTRPASGALAVVPAHSVEPAVVVADPPSVDDATPDVPTLPATSPHVEGAVNEAQRVQATSEVAVPEAEATEVLAGAPVDEATPAAAEGDLDTSAA